MALETFKLRRQRAFQRKQSSINSNLEHELRLELKALGENELTECDKIMVEVPKKDLVVFTSILQDGSLPWLSYRKVDTTLFELWSVDLLSM